MPQINHFAWFFPTVFLFCIAAYFFGGVLFSPIFGKLLSKNIRNEGSKNAGATNLIRTTNNKVIGIAASCCDMLKSFFPIFFLWLVIKLVFTGEYWHTTNLAFGALIFLPGVFAVIGHWIPFLYVFHFFKNGCRKENLQSYCGGKGVSTFAGIIISFSPWIMLIGVTLFFSIALLTHYVSLSSLITSLTMALLVWVKPLDLIYLKVWDDSSLIFQHEWYFIGLVFLFLLSCVVIIWYAHRKNIVRLFKGTESKAFVKKQKQA